MKEPEIIFIGTFRGRWFLFYAVTNRCRLNHRKIPAASAIAHPIGTDHQIPVIPTAGKADRVYASTMRLPREITVSRMETEDLPSPRNRPYSRKSIPIPA